MSHELKLRSYGTGKRGSYFLVAYDDTGRVIGRSGLYYATVRQAQTATNEMFKYYGNKVWSVKIVKYRPRRNPETVATAVVAAAPTVTPLTNQRM